jgi:hypothetical protein
MGLSRWLRGVTPMARHALPVRSPRLEPAIAVLSWCLERERAVAVDLLVHRVGRVQTGCVANLVVGAVLAGG